MSCNDKFLKVLKESLITYWQTSARSNEKLKNLHSFVAKDLLYRMKQEECCAYALGLCDEYGRETCIQGRYVDKKVDIALCINNEKIAGIGLKYVMSNYSQNSNNYFESMLGETANIRSAGVPYFQIFCIFDKLPYFDKSGNIKKWEKITEHHLSKYIKLSNDNIEYYYHTPNKTLVYLLHIEQEIDKKIKTKEELRNFYLHNDFQIRLAAVENDFGKSVIINDYETFANKAIYAIKSI